MADFKKQIKEILGSRGFDPNKYSEFLEAMGDVFHATAEKVFTNEPQQTKQIADFRAIGNDLYDPEDFINKYSYEQVEEE
jgi:hypothetical protein